MKILDRIRGRSEAAPIPGRDAFVVRGREDDSDPAVQAQRLLDANWDRFSASYTGWIAVSAEGIVVANEPTLREVFANVPEKHRGKVAVANFQPDPSEAV